MQLAPVPAGGSHPGVMIEKSAPSLWAGFKSGLLDLNHTSTMMSASVFQIAKFVTELAAQ
jgi:hypothetical protein